MGMEFLKEKVKTRNLICAFIFIIVIIYPLLLNATVETTTDDVYLCSKYIEEKEYSKAITVCTVAIKILPKAWAIHQNDSGATYKYSEQYEKDFADYKKVLVACYNNRGIAYKEKKEYDKAFADHTKAIELDPSSSNAYNGRGLFYFATGSYDKAIDDYTIAIKLQPDFGIYNNRALAYYYKGEHEKALVDFIKTVELNPKDSLSYYNIACLYSIKNNIEEACNWLNKAIEKGYDNWNSIKQDKDLANIRNSPCYKQIISGH